MDSLDVGPLEQQLWNQLPQCLEDLWSTPETEEDKQNARDVERLTEQIEKMTMDGMERTQTRNALVRILGTSRNGQEEKIIKALNLLDNQTPSEELGQCVWKETPSREREEFWGP